MMPKRKRKKKPDPDILRPATAPPKPVKPSAGPVFTAIFSDGVTTRMSIYSPASPVGKLDVRRGVAVSKAAHSSRTKTPMAEVTSTIVDARFESIGGAPLASYTTEDLQRRWHHEHAQHHRQHP